MYEPMKCNKCDAIAYYPDEVVVGVWLSNRGERVDSDHESNVFVAGTHNAGWIAYCLDCAPCECGDHAKFVAHTAENITAWEQVQG